MKTYSKTEIFSAVICGFSLLLFLIQQTYLGLKTAPSEVDSLIYHLPIAVHIKEHGFLSVPSISQGWGWYPAVGETILSVFLLMGGNFVNLYNVLGIIVLALVSFFLGRKNRLSPPFSIVYAVSVSLLNPAMRLVNNQTVDIWFQAFTLASILSLQFLRNTLKHSLVTGLALGLVMGTKYSGFFAAIFLIGLFFHRIKKLSPFNLVVFLAPILLVGGFWYIRNLLLVGNPFYPANINLMDLNLKGHPGNIIADWIPLKTLIYVPGGIALFLKAVISEYSVWLVFLLFFFLQMLMERHLSKIDGKLFRIIAAGIILSSMFLFTPSWPKNIVSDLRYTLPGVSLLILAFFIHFQENLRILPLYAALISIVFNFPLLTHHPKANAIISAIFIVFLGIFRNEKYFNFKSRNLRR